MEDDPVQNSTSLVPVAIGILALFLGGAGLYFGFTANQRLNAIEQSVNSSEGLAARTDKALADLNQQLQDVRAATTKAERELNAVKTSNRVGAGQVQGKFEEIVASLRETQEAVAKLASGRVRPAEPAPAENVTVRAEGGTASAASSAGGTGGVTYQIQSGDTFQRIAQAQGVNVQAIMDANPGVDPRRLRIGQVINLPPSGSQ